METKICTQCREEKTIDMYCKTHTTKGGYKAACKSCTAKYDKQHHIDNLQRDRKYHQVYYKNNIEKEKASHKNYRTQNVDKIKISSRKYYEDNIEKTRLYGQRYRKENPEKACIKAHNYRAKKSMLPHTLTIEQWESIKLSFDNSCAYCGKKMFLTQEHFIALNKGGEYTTNNIIPSCQSCNCSKIDRDFFEWYPKFRHYSKKRETFILEHLQYINETQQLALTI